MPIRKKETKFFKKYPEVRQVNTCIPKLRKPCLLSNGSCCPPVAVPSTDGKNNYFQVTNTCAFDAVIHILVTAATDIIGYLSFLKESQNPTLKLVRSIVESGITKKSFVERFTILKDFFPSSMSINTERTYMLHSIDATTSVASIVEKTLSSEPSVRNTVKCSHCDGRVFNDILLRPNHHTISRQGFGALEKALEYFPKLTKVTCGKTCTGSCTVTKKLMPHCFIELDIRSSLKQMNGQQCQLSQLPAVINLREWDSW